MQTDRIDLVKVCCQRFQGAKAEAAAAVARRVSEFKDLLETALLEYHGTLGELYRFANYAAERGTEEIAQLAKKLGVALAVPTLEISYGQEAEVNRHHWENAWQNAERTIDTLERQGAEQVERMSMDTLIQLMDKDLTLEEAKALVENIPSADQLIPHLNCEGLALEPDLARTRNQPEC